MHKQGVSIGLAARIVVVDRLCSLVTLLIVIALGLPHLSTLHGSEIFKQSTTLAFVLGCAALAGLSAVQLIARIIPTTSRMRHLHQLSKDFNHTLFGNAVTTIKMLLWSS